MQTTLGEGFHVVSPFSTVYIYDLREQQKEERLDVLANNGLAITLDASVIYQPIPAELSQLHSKVGRDYYDVLIGPVLRSKAREVVGQFSPEEVYSTKRTEVEKDIFQQVSKKMEGKHLQIDAILIRDVHLPAIVEQAINRKLQEEQRALEMTYVLDRERQEAERKRIEAAGIADYQQIISKGLNNELLEWKGIEATEKLARSPNSKTIVIESGKGGLPLILNPGGSRLSN
ncbi:MAG TPA: prohibitin family protein [Nitrospiria bacterium]|nr:prohibitin family protein [Nitrospiria bacterium]